MRSVILAALAALALTGAAEASCPTQPAGPIVGPKNVCFQKAANNDTVEAGVAVVTGYKLVIHKVSDGSVVSTTDIGKPTPDADGDIHVDNFTGFSGLTPGVEATVQTVAYGPGGTTPDGDSVSFLRPSSPALPGTAIVFP